MNYWATSDDGTGHCAGGTSELDIGLFLSKNWTMAVIPESAELYCSGISCKMMLLMYVIIKLI